MVDDDKYRKGWSTLTAEQRDYIFTNRFEKMPNQLARELKIEAWKVSQYLCKNGLNPSENHVFPSTGRTRSGRLIWTDDMISFLKINFLNMTNQQLADALGLKLTKVREKCYELGLKRMELEFWSKEQVDFLLAYYEIMGDVEIAEIFNQLYAKKKGWTLKHIEKKRRYLKLRRTRTQVKKIKNRNITQGRFSVNHWKRWAHNRARKQGETAVWYDNSQRPTVVIKWSGGRFFGIYDTWAHINWFLHYGGISDGMLITHKDGDSLNCSIENLECITREDHARRNALDAAAALSDNYIRGILTHRKPELRKYLPQELIELKRQQLILNRTINNHG